MQVHDPATWTVSAPICLLPPPQNTGATGNCALRKICLLHLQSEIRSKAMKIHGKNMWIFVSARKGLEKAWHFSLAFYFGALHHQPLVLITALPKAPDLAGHSPICKCYVTTLLSHSPVVTTGSQIPGVKNPLSICNQRNGPWPSDLLCMPVWIRLISEIIQVRRGSTRLWAPRAAADTAGTTCSPPTT